MSYDRNIADRKMKTPTLDFRFRRSLVAIFLSLISLSSNASATQSKWANRKLLPEYEAMLQSGAFSGGTDSTQSISEERDAR